MSENNDQTGNNHSWIFKNKKTLLLIFLIICLSLGLYYLVRQGRSQNIDQNNQTAIFLTYENSRFGFSIQYPKNWQLGEAPTNKDGREISSADNQAECRAYGFLNTLTNDSGQAQTLDQYVDWVAENARGEAKNTNFSIIEKSSSKLDGYDAKRLVLNSNGAISDSIYAFKAEEGFGFSCEYKSLDQKEKFKAEFDSMSKSFKIK